MISTRVKNTEKSNFGEIKNAFLLIIDLIKANIKAVHVRFIIFREKIILQRKHQGRKGQR